MALEKELATYEAKLSSLSKDAGKFVVIQEDNVIDVFETYSDALKAAYKRFGTEGRFLVKQISPVPHVSFISRHIAPCPV